MQSHDPVNNDASKGVIGWVTDGSRALPRPVAMMGLGSWVKFMGWKVWKGVVGLRCVEGFWRHDPTASEERGGPKFRPSGELCLIHTDTCRARGAGATRGCSLLAA